MFICNGKDCIAKPCRYNPTEKEIKRMLIEHVEIKEAKNLRCFLGEKTNE